MANDGAIAQILSMRQNRADPLISVKIFSGVCGIYPVLELGNEPGSGVNPVAIDGCHRDLEQTGELGHGQAGEEVELDQLGYPLDLPPQAC